MVSFNSMKLLQPTLMSELQEDDRFRCPLYYNHSIPSLKYAVTKVLLPMGDSLSSCTLMKMGVSLSCSVSD